MAEIKFGILTVSDTCYAETNEDRSGPALEKAVLSSFPTAIILQRSLVPDCQDAIADVLIKWSLPLSSCNVILTTGGTGFAPRDVTPEATRRVIEKEAPALSYAMISKSLEVTDMAMLSRAVCGTRNQTLIINLPGSVKGSTECFSFVRPAIPHAVALLTGNKEVVVRDHQRIQGLPCGSSKVIVDEVAKRNRHSPFPMVEFHSAQKIVFEQRPGTTEKETVNLENCLNRILSEDVYAVDNLPPFPASIKDGYAVRALDGAGVRFVRDAVAAGDSLSQNQPLAPGEIVRISTGAAVPQGADAVVQVEDTSLVLASEDGKREVQVSINVAPVVGQDIRKVGSDIAKGSLVLKRHSLITAGNVGILAAVGKAQIQVYRKARIAVLSTGNELQDPHETLKPGHVRDTNRLTLLSLLKQYGHAPSDCGIVRDTPDSVKAALDQALSTHDYVITTGGVSMGEFDLVKRVLVEDFGATIHFGRVNMKPGKPTTFSTLTYGGAKKTVFGLPGNPVSALVTATVFVIPSLRYYENYENPQLPEIEVILGEDFKTDPRPEWARVVLKRSNLDSKVYAFPTGNQISSRIGSFEDAGGLLLLPNSEQVKVCLKGDTFTTAILDPLTIKDWKK